MQRWKMDANRPFSESTEFYAMKGPATTYGLDYHGCNKTIVLSEQYHGDHSTHYSTSCILEREQMVTARRLLEIW